MNYSNVYDSLILRARSRTSLEGYSERHHILPKSLGGSNESENLVDLTGREHYLAHKLLVKIYPESRVMKYALGLMTHTGKAKYEISAKDFELGRIAARDAILGTKRSAKTRAKMSKPKSDEHKLNISNARKGKLNPMYGTISPTRDIPHSDETKKRISEITKARTDFPPCPHCGKKVNKGNAMRWHYDNCKHKVQL